MTYMSNRLLDALPQKQEEEEGNGGKGKKHGGK